MKPRILEVRQNILKKNDEQARGLRRRFADAGVFVVSLVSSPGAGKTTLLRQTLIDLSARHRVAALVGDLATENDAKRLAESGAPVKQIVTGTVCHLEAEMVENALSDWSLADLDLLFIENVGNLVCPASYDLGENVRAVLFSTTEGEDKPLKYPTIFNTADLAILTKSDLADVVGFDRAKARGSIQDVRPGMQTIELSAKTGQGMGVWIAWLDDCIARRQARRSAMLVEAPLGNILDTPAASDDAIDWLDLTWEECGQRTMRKTTRGGVPVRILLRLGRLLRHGDLLSDSPLIAVHVVPCEVLIVRLCDPSEWTAAAYELGNLHVAVQIDGDQIITLCDGPTEAIFGQLGLATEIRTQRFEPTFRGTPPIALISST